MCKYLKRLWKDKKAEANLGVYGVLVTISVVAIILIVLFEVIPVIGYNAQTANAIPTGTQASDTLTLTGNVSCGQLVNVTNRAGNVAVFVANITADFCAAPAAEYAAVAIPRFMNTSTTYAINLTTALNANATVSGTMTATNPSAGVVLLQFNGRGLLGNEVRVAESLTNGAWSSTNFSGGVNLNAWSSADNDNIANGSEMWTTNSPMISVGLLIGVIAVIIGLLMATLGGGGFGFGKDNSGQGGAGM